MIRALLLAIGDLADRRILAILFWSLAITLGLVAGLGVGAAWLLAGLDPCSWFGDGSCMLGEGSATFGGLLFFFVALWLLFPAIALGVIGGFFGPVIAAVEQRHYPAAAALAQPLGPVRALQLGLGSALRLLIYNAIALPFYVLLLVTAIGPLLLFLAVNGAAIGRDLALMVALRHGRVSDARGWLRASRGDRLLLGTAIAALFLVPFLNLLAPILGAAAATHLYHRYAPRVAREELPVQPIA